MSDATLYLLSAIIQATAVAYVLLLTLYFHYRKEIRERGDPKQEKVLLNWQKNLYWFLMLTIGWSTATIGIGLFALFGFYDNISLIYFVVAMSLATFCALGFIACYTIWPKYTEARRALSKLETKENQEQ
ncbi:MAG: hypothetical protein KAR39_10835 [Thermoplasmata archaeon]|nr:hypothetical protein [Thermoplasmata archaeon]